jgi:excinuclease UvrABC ATPase subunit
VPVVVDVTLVLETDEVVDVGGEVVEVGGEVVEVGEEVIEVALAAR